MKLISQLERLISVYIFYMKVYVLHWFS